MGLSEKDELLLQCIEDPVMWAQVELNEMPRDYQIDMLRNKSKRKVSRCGRRIGKCSHFSSKIVTDIGLVSVEDLYKNKANRPAVISFDEETQTIIKTTDYFINDNGKKPVYKITTSTGRQNIMTENHPFLTIDTNGSFGWIQIQDMAVGDRIAIPKTYKDLIPGKPVGTEKSRLFGHSCEVEGEVPQAIMAGTTEDIANFLGAYWDCGGWCSIQGETYDKSPASRVEVGCVSPTEKLARGVHHLLLRLGIVAKLKEKKVEYNDEYRLTWQITIDNAEGIKNFVRKIPLVSVKKEKLDKILTLLDSKNYSGNKYIDTIPKEVWSYIKKKQKELGLSNMQVCGAKSRKSNKRLRTEYAISREKLSVYAENLNDNYLAKLANNNILWDEVVSIEYIGEEQTYDLSVPETHTFIADDIISHNTWTMCIHILWYAFTHAKSRQVIATPYESQITLIFDQLRKFIDKSPALQQSIAYNRRNPQYIEFKNGAWIKGFTAGTRSGAEGGSLRGQGADWIYMDEVDYMTDADFETIYAIALEAPERIGVWISSTPTGRRGMFWKVCTMKEMGWHEFYYPTMVNPEWSPSMEKELRGMFSDVAYQHEVLAEFGDETIGVFKKEFIDRARQDYPYTDRVSHVAHRIIGVDWDKYGNATQIIVTEYDPFPNEGRGVFKIINRIEIPKGHFTLDNGVRKIIELNTYYDPDYIYVDRGYGEYQVETLHKYGLEHPESKLHNKVKGIAFSGSVEVRDPFTKVVERKPVKPFMVNQTNLLLERDRIWVSEQDDMVWKQMENYQVIRVTTSGQPVYTSEFEHALDAFMLTILGFVTQMPDIAKVIDKPNVARKMITAKIATPDPLILLNNDPDNDYAQSWDEPGVPPLKKVPLGTKPNRNKNAGLSWARRGSPDGIKRSKRLPKRKSW